MLVSTITQLVREYKPKLFLYDSFVVDGTTTTVKVYLRKRRRSVRQYQEDTLPPIELEKIRVGAS